jgi:carbamoyl-phosphate synthase large subunit
MVGRTLQQQGVTKEKVPDYYFVKEAVFPFIKFPGVDTVLGPEMKSTGEVMGVGETFGEAYAKAQSGAGATLPLRGKAMLSVRDADKPRLLQVAQDLLALGFELYGTGGTAASLQAGGIQCHRVNKVAEGRPHILDMLKNGEVSFIVNTTDGADAVVDSSIIRRAALQNKVSYTTTISGAEATCLALTHLDDVSVNSLQELHASAVA